jgi:hypothetical protein
LYTNAQLDFIIDLYCYGKKIQPLGIREFERAKSLVQSFDFSFCCNNYFVQDWTAIQTESCSVNITLAYFRLASNTNKAVMTHFRIGSKRIQKYLIKGFRDFLISLNNKLNVNFCRKAAKMWM